MARLGALAISSNVAARFTIDAASHDLSIYTLTDDPYQAKRVSDAICNSNRQWAYAWTIDAFLLSNPYLGQGGGFCRTKGDIDQFATPGPGNADGR
jgi:hypothetical protein